MSEDIIYLKGQLSSPNILQGTLPKQSTLQATLTNMSTLGGSLSNAALRGMSAYEIAVAAGFVGTGEKWLETLKGEKIKIRNNKGVLEWKYENDLAWRTLVDRAAVNDYKLLMNKPRIDGVILSGDRDLSTDYVRNENSLTNLEIEELFNR